MRPGAETRTLVMSPRSPVLAVLLLLLLAAQVTVATEETPCEPGQYEVTNLRRCSTLCPAGYYVSKPAEQGRRVGECTACASGTFRAHPSEEGSCEPCAQCREDQEEVTACSATSDRLCQCRQGSFYCDSPHCTESCFRCTRCADSAILQPCNATRNAVCAVKTQPGAEYLRGWLLPFATVLVISVAIIIGVLIVCCCRERAARFIQSAVCFPNQNPREPGSPVSISLGCVRSSPGEHERRATPGPPACVHTQPVRWGLRPPP
ncbi:tumor necrosis factor receptor superfamily member 26-like isoform X2 [Hippopotamus amphibius kiboko]|uniref:tumor necrosis factor receptor superfamily member 26-like isoform X2 n=1 Tax=Hippopotamus amphibius kiboko TaxID=575201 RepID=UPI00259818C9|nr:tumor necrosis factor receptor superfamily member 26-like isoform X2 [Hippopotamus amphibius kiboko]